MVAFSKRYLRFNDNPSRRAKHFHVLWPVYAYRISYFESNDKSLNLFQEGILGLFRAGCQQMGEISQLLDLDIDLVKFIVATQLQPNGWLDEKGKITKKGKRKLDGDNYEKGSLYKDKKTTKEKQKIGYIFWDVLSQAWMPRFSKRLNEIESEGHFDDDFPSFMPERQKGGRSFKPFCLKVALGAQQKPIIDNSEEIIKAYRHYRLDIHHARQLGTQFEDQDNFHMNKIEFISEEPEPMYLWVSIFHNTHSDELWSIQDPFPIRTAVPWLRESFLSAISNQPEFLAQKISRLIGKPREDKQTVEEWLKNLDQQVRLEILIDYPYLKNQPVISRYLQAVKHRQEQINSGLSQGSNLESLLTDAQKLLESILKWMLGEWDVDLRSLPNVNQAISKEERKRIYQCLGLPAIESVADQLSNQDWRKVHSVLRYKDQARASLKALLCGVLLSTVDNQDHPFKQLSGEELGLPKLLKLADLRNQAGHASGNTFKKEEVTSLCNFAMNWVNNFKEWL